VKSINGYNFGQEDFIKNYMHQTLKDINIKLYNDITKSPKDLLKIKNIFEKTIKLFDNKPEIEIELKKIFNNYDYNIVLNEQDYINSNTVLFNKIISSIKSILKQSKLSEIQIDDIVLIGGASKSGYMKKILSEIFKNNKVIYNKLLNINDNIFENDEHYLVSGAALEAMNTNLKPISKKYIFLDICPISFGIENSSGEVDLIIKKGNKVPITQKNFVKIYRKKDTDFVDIKICEINSDNKKVVLSCSNINGKNMKIFDKNDQTENEFVELLFELEIDENFNLSVFILDRQTFKRRFEFSINIDVIKDKDKDKEKIL
jgi:molecular chaperone DnaK (HSP70)